MSKIYPAKILLRRISTLFPDAIFYREISAPLIALTIDDVGDSSTELIIKAIANYNHNYSHIYKSVKATFFVITNYMKEAKIINNLIKQGHEIGNHGQTDRTHANLSPSEFAEEINQAHQILTENNNVNIKWFRPGRGFYNQDMFKILQKMAIHKGYQSRFALASMIPLDTYNFINQPQFLFRYIINFVFPGSILVLHGGTVERAKNTVLVLNKLLPYLQEQGYQIVSLSELFSEK